MTELSLRKALAPFLERDTEEPATFGDPGRSGPDALEALANRIYLACHCLQQTPANADSPFGVLLRERQFRTDLSNANGGTGPWHAGWTVAGAAIDGRLPVEHGGLCLWAAPDELRGNQNVGSAVQVRFPKEYLRLFPNFYVMIGDADAGQRIDRLRLYWHLTPGAGPLIVEQLSRTLNAAGVAFRFKLLSDPTRYLRTDAGVLYLPLQEVDSTLPLVRDVYFRVRERLRAPVSDFVHPLAPGLGLAEDPPDGSSFGLHRSRLLAPLIVAARQARASIEQVFRHVRDSGHDPDRFFVNPESTRRYPTWG